MTEYETLNAKLEVYLSLLDVMPATKSVHRKAISEFLPLLLERGRNIPLDDDYDDYRYYLLFQKKKSITLIQPIIRYIERFFSWVAENPECTSLETVNTKPEQRPRLKRTRKVSVLLSPYLYDSLMLLADNDCTDIPTMLNALVSRYVAHRKNDIDRVKGMAISEAQNGA